MYRKRNGYRKKIRYAAISIVLSLIFSSCIDNPPTSPEVTDYQSYFYLVWELYDEKYVGFDIKDVDWNAVYALYSPMVAHVKRYEEMKELIILLVGTLDDRNAWLCCTSYPDHTFHTYTSTFETNYVDSVLMDLLEPWEFQWDSSSSFGSMWGHCVIDTIPYFAIRHFEYYFTFQSFRDELLKHVDAPGMIIDIRMSDGLSLVPSEQIPCVFTDQYGIAFFTQHRTGPEHNDLSPLSIHEVSPRSWAYTKPVVLLMGEQNIGAAEALASLMKQLSHVTVIGDTTGGSGNVPGYFAQRYWPLWNDWTITCPFARVLTADTVLIEENGILPDIYVQATPADFLAGHDPVLEYAIEWIAEETAP
ncbi:MAG: hypothetical protein KAW14_03660 [Candidatus Aegiribacteria sp.]|nr:hypothetical protein [Candidatus Aegiribacteria sp.]